MTIGEKIRAVREKLGVSQQEVQRRSGVERNSISLIENNHRSPSFKTLARLAQALGVSVGYITDYEEVQNYLPVTTTTTRPRLVAEAAPKNIIPNGYISIPIIGKGNARRSPNLLSSGCIEDYILVPDNWLGEKKDYYCCSWVKTNENALTPLINVGALVCIATHHKNPNKLSGKIVAFIDKNGDCLIRRLKLQQGFLIGLPEDASQNQTLLITTRQKGILLGEVIWFWSRINK